ncbi:MAG: lantibiotic dehydratase C-terminal domain-containing protein [Acidobacteriota bacterium]
MTATAWREYRLFYHGDRDRAVLGFVAPVAAQLRRDGLLHRAFFVRYSLGGPHLRMRLEAGAHQSSEIDAAVRRRSEIFLRAEPSPDPLDPEQIRRTNRGILASDGSGKGDGADQIFPNNSLMEADFEPEVERYGGHDALPLAFDLFQASSLAAIDLLRRTAEAPKARRFASCLRTLALQALGMAGDGRKWLDLLAYPSAINNSLPAQALQDKADAAWGPQRKGLETLLRAEIERVLGWAEGTDPTSAEEPCAGLLYRRAYRWGRRAPANGDPENDSQQRLRADASQMHMTANRLGLRNSDEIFAARLLERTGRSLESSKPDLWNALDAVLQKHPRPLPNAVSAAGDDAGDLDHFLLSGRTPGAVEPAPELTDRAPRP